MTLRVSGPWPRLGTASPGRRQVAGETSPPLCGSHRGRAVPETATSLTSTRRIFYTPHVCRAAPSSLFTTLQRALLPVRGFPVLWAGLLGGGGGASTQIQDGVVCAVLAQLLLKENIFRVIAFPFSLCFIEV